MEVFLIIIIVVVVGFIILAVQQKNWFHWPGKSNIDYSKNTLDLIITDITNNIQSYTFANGTSSQFLKKVDDKNFLMGPDCILRKPFHCVPNEDQKIKLKKLLIKVRSNDSFAVNQYRHPHGRY